MVRYKLLTRQDTPAGKFSRFFARVALNDPRQAIMNCLVANQVRDLTNWFVWELINFITVHNKP